MKKFKNICLLFLISVAFNGLAQVFTPGDYKDGIYDKENAVNRRFIPYTHLREGDVTWEKRIWRSIDIREKINQQLYYPVTKTDGRMSLIQVILKYVLNGEIIAFQDEEFQVPYLKADIRSKIVIQTTDSVEASQFDDQGNEYFVKTLPPADSVWIYENFCSVDLKEDWFFDKQKSSLEVRVIGLGFGALRKGKEDLGCNPLFYTYFPACRPYFAKHEVFNAKNDSERRTFEDIFWKRQFSSMVTKESNVWDREINQYSKGLDALFESDRIKGDIFKWEHDLWHF